MITRSPWLCAGVLMLALTAVVACGRKTLPSVPDSPRPEAIKDIKAVTRDTVALLSWPLPTRNVEGKGMTPADISQFRVYRADFGHDKKKARYKPYADIDMTNPAPATVQNNRVFWSDNQLKYGQIYGYRVRAVSVRRGVSELSEEVRVAPLLSLAIPKGLKAQGGDGSNQCTWEPVTTRMDGSSYDGFVGYNIYRSTDRGRFEEAPLNAEPLRTTSYKDTSVVNDKLYFYMLRSVDSPALPWKESPDSEAVSVTARDSTPPASPTGLTVVPGVGRVFLTWNENTERDLAGYHVYRSARSGREYERITSKALNRTTYSDETAKSGNTYYYCITAVDKTGNESAMSEDKKAFLEKMK